MINNQSHPNTCICFSWKPIMAGALAAIGFSFLLNLFSVAIGLTAFTVDTQGAEKLVLGGLIATALGSVVSLFAAGWLAGYLGSRYCEKRHLGALYGFLAWCLALVITLFLTDHIAHYVTAYTHFISGSTVSVNAAMTNQGLALTTHAPTEKMAISAYIVFCLFFLGAFASSLGGHCGMQCSNQDDV